MEDLIPRPVTRASSDSDEPIGRRDSTDFVNLQETSTIAIESMSTEWTDEKHSLYLKSMEASFVNDLYNSMDSLGWRSQRNYTSDVNSHAQFKVLRGGCWKNINVKKTESQVEKAEESRAILKNQWIRHFRSANQHQTVISNDNDAHDNQAGPSRRMKASSRGLGSTGSEKFATSVDKFPETHPRSYRYDSLETNTEVSDQNFVDEDIKEKKPSRSIFSAKRMKSTVVAVPSNDQVVPSGRPQVDEDCVSSERKKRDFV